jgi:hypothetical protein
MATATNHPAAQALAPVPSWLRGKPPATETEAAFLAGAALAVLDARVRTDAPFAGVWRRRLALTAAAASAKILRRAEDEAALRDAFFLRSGDADAGPAGRLLLAWRSLDRSAPLDRDAVSHAAGLLNVKVDEALSTALTEVQQIAAATDIAPLAAAEAVRKVMAQRPDAEILALWLADAVLATRLKWPLPLPLLAAALIHPSLRVDARRPHPSDQDFVRSCYAAYARAAAAACDLFGEIEHNSHRLRAVERSLRAKAAKTVIAKLHDEDAVPASARIAGLSDRGLRRLFERLAALGAVRELTGRPTFRLYGL